ncbi:MAG: group III truncated hemoglobin [Ignavibacteria bacterium]|nr:group III truncated hemoglobin [Ignavibacteria bacterium]
MNNKQDILVRGDVVRLIDAFYNEVRKDPVIGHIFNEVVSVDWDAHMPTMYSFWSTLLLNEQTYSGNPMLKHVALSKKTPMTNVEFTQWLKLFNTTVDELFEGATATMAKQRAATIAELMMVKIQDAVAV